MTTLAILQAAQAVGAAASGRPLGEWLALITTGLMVSAGVWRVAVVSTKTGQIEGLMTRELTIINEKLDAINRHVEEADARLVADVRWATETSTRLGTVERRVEVIDTERRGGVVDRRESRP